MDKMVVNSLVKVVMIEANLNKMVMISVEGTI